MAFKQNSVVRYYLSHQRSLLITPPPQTKIKPKKILTFDILKSVQLVLPSDSDTLQKMAKMLLSSLYPEQKHLCVT